MFSIIDLKKKNAPQPFDLSLDIKESLLSRNPEILDLEKVTAKGQVSYEDGLFFLDYDLTYTITLPSSRSMEPVQLPEKLVVKEVFAEESTASQKGLTDQDLVLIIEGDSIDLEESVVDNILLNIPLRVLSPAEEADDQLPSGQSWSVLTESQYRAQKAEEKSANSPFAALDGLFQD